MISKGILMISLLFSVAAVSCSKSEPDPTPTPEPTPTYSCKTGTAVSITETSASLPGTAELPSDKKASAAYGVIYSVNSERFDYSTGTVLTTASASSTGEFSVTLEGLLPGTRYYYRAYAKCGSDLYLGDICDFTTKDSSSSVAGKAVDLGLSVKWASCNVGALAAEDYGIYVSWGETEPKSSYNWTTYMWCKGSETSITKYCVHSTSGTVDGKKVLDSSDDPAYIKWGNKWSMPTKAQWDELMTKCKWEWTTSNGHKGYLITSNVNTNSIFLPAAGYYSDDKRSSEEAYGLYMSSELNPDASNKGLGIYIAETLIQWGDSFRSYGRPVRAVSK